MAALILEIQAQGRGQPQYRRVRNFPYRMGRAYDNDLILPDATVSPHHLQIVCDEAGTLHIENLSEENGTRIVNRVVDTPIVLDAEPLSVTLGRTTVRIMRPETAVAATQKYTHDSLWWQQMTRLPVALLLLALVTLLNFWQSLGVSMEPEKWQQVLLMQLVGVVATLVFATFTGFVSRMLTHRWRFGLQITIACCLLLALSGKQELGGMVDYYFSSPVISRWLNVAVIATLFTALFAWQLRAMTHMGRERATLVAVAVIWPVLALFQLKDVFDGDEFSPQPAMHTELRVPDWRAAKTLDIADFRARVAQQLQTSPDVVTDEKVTPPQAH